MTPEPAFSGSHEDPAMLAVMSSPLAAQRETLDGWGLSGVGLVHLLSSCHGGCFFCSNRSLTEMPAAWVTSRDVVAARLDGIEGLASLCVGGTEPLTHPSLPAILARARSAGVPVELMTSGLELAAPAAAARLAQDGVARVAVPLYAPTAPLHDDVVGRPGQHAVVVDGLDRAVAAGIGVEVHTLALRRTLPALRALARQVRERWGATLAVAPLRRKDDLFRYEDEAPSYREVEAALAGADVRLVGFPACVAPDVPRGGPAHLDVYGDGELRPVQGERA
jgi:MoaA/NifB/PqqE/SkfB family radical SAM enzyme